MKLVTCGLAFGYAGEPVGRDVDLALEGGEVLCLLGPNGSGKTTLFKTLLGLLKVQAGEITLDSVPLADWSRRRLAQVMAYVPQAAAGYFPFTVLETVLMGRTARLGLFATPSRRDRLVAEAALAAVGIEHLENHIFTRLSGGQRQLTLIARALAQEPRILVMDEPTASLDFGNQIPGAGPCPGASPAQYRHRSGYSRSRSRPGLRRPGGATAAGTSHRLWPAGGSHHQRQPVGAVRDRC